VNLTIITTIIAALVAIITYGQWRTNRARLKHELFERRYKEYQKITRFLASIVTNGHVSKGGEMLFLRDTKRAYFVFGCDKKVQKLLSEIYRQSVELYTLDSTLNDRQNPEVRKQNIEKQRLIKNWFETTLRGIENEFERFLKLEH
jgi:hypothetical protein